MTTPTQPLNLWLVAAWSAAWSAADAALRPTREQVQLLALDLVDRMLAVTPETLPAGWVPPSQAVQS